MKTLRFGLLTVSDRSARGEREDVSGAVVADFLRARGGEIPRMDIVPDEMDVLIETLIEWADSGEMDILLTIGGTGFAPRDVTPEATRAVVSRLAPGFAEAMRAESLKITPHAILSRAVAGIRGETFILNLPGSPRAALENLRVVFPALPHAVELMQNAPNAERGHAATPKG